MTIKPESGSLGAAGEWTERGCGVYKDFDELIATAESPLEAAKFAQAFNLSLSQRRDELDRTEKRLDIWMEDCRCYSENCDLQDEIIAALREELETTKRNQHEVVHGWREIVEKQDSKLVALRERIKELEKP